MVHAIILIINKTAYKKHVSHYKNDTFHQQLQFNSIYTQIVSICNTFSAMTLLVRHQEEHPACKKFEWCGAGMVICLERGADDLHMIHCHPIIFSFIKIQNGHAFLVPAYPGCPEKEAIKWEYVVSICKIFKQVQTLLILLLLQILIALGLQYYTTTI